MQLILVWTLARGHVCLNILLPCFYIILKTLITKLADKDNEKY